MMRRNGNAWLISDIYLDGAISEVATRRSAAAEPFLQVAKFTREADWLAEQTGFEPLVPRQRNPLVETVSFDLSGTSASERDRGFESRLLHLQVGTEMRACGPRRGFCGLVAPHGLCGSFSRKMIFNFGAAIIPRISTRLSH